MRQFHFLESEQCKRNCAPPPEAEKEPRLCSQRNLFQLVALSGPTSVTLGTQTSPALLLSAVNVQKVCTCRSSGSSFWSSCHTCHPWRSRRTDVTQLRLRSLWQITAVLVNELENRRTGGPEEETGEAPWGEEAWVFRVGLFVEKVSTLSRFTACRALVLTGGHGVPESRTSSSF